ncbi:MAG TPA: hypothetical protein VEC92_01155 [Nitrososphaerales archaeon]|nr:hypothetical protein [Nitrososphaerales archaeon]
MTRPESKRGGKGSPRPSSGASLIEGARRVLLRAANRGETVTYGTLMKAFGLSRGRALTGMISAVDQRECASHAPGFAAIIVRKDTGYPGGGYFCDATLPPTLRRPLSRASDPRLSPAERNYIRKKQREIWECYARTRPSP